MELEFIYLGLFVLCSLWHCYSDFKEMLLYDEVSMAMLSVGILRSYGNHEIINSIIGAVITGIVFLLLFYFSKGGMGFGDVKLAVVLGLWLGWQGGLMSLLLALWLGFIVGIMLIITGKKQRHEAIAFGPYMCCGGIVMLLYGKEILNWYQGWFY